MNPSPPPEPAQPHIVVPAGQPALGQQHPNFVYINGRPYHVTQQPQVVTVQLPAAQASMHQWLRDMIVVTILVLAVVAVCTAGICAAVVCGSTLIGTVGTLGANVPMIGVTLVGLVLAAGWAANKFKKATSDK